MPRLVNIKATKDEFYGAKRPMKIWEVNVDNIVILELVETSNASKVFNWMFICYKTVSFDIA